MLNNFYQILLHLILLYFSTKFVVTFVFMLSGLKITECHLGKNALDQQFLKFCTKKSCSCRFLGVYLITVVHCLLVYLEAAVPGYSNSLF